MKLTLKTKKMKNLSANHAMLAQLTPLVQGGAMVGLLNDNPPATGSNVTTCSEESWKK
ncbi:hypothetical protein [Pseudoalteromonas sp. R3]|uniref:hypothetical protein n=1 Tax=Pseudoalteromonas sp. R3 TaxID=1709477 RepID=UPI000AB75A4F|nr:hypothetical protein [Pseudoalteromonas sp. R3]